MMTAEELLPPDQFRVEIHQPEQIYQEVYNALNGIFTHGELFSSRDERLPPVFHLGNFTSETGLFSQIGVHLPVYYPDPEGFFILLNAYCRGEDGDYWNFEERGKLHALLSRYYGTGLIYHVKDQDGINFVAVDDPSEQMRYLISLGWEDEKEKWLGQVRLINQALQEDNIFESREELQGNLRHLIDNPTPLPGTRITMALAHIDTDPLDQSPNPILQLGGQKDFVRRLKKFGQFVERAINGILEVKGVPQSGILNLHPPQRADIV